ncbi:MAG: formylglycine-generating enzyme family protein [Planctomycetes bacterium]|nr:formylglycine-generating enzyme family protein [Planctomycetota bacterium]MCH9724061.1 formylglycine-generating enzyme family protein [Planctomycetota bacterium]MCH9778117.1 formylglycine-generating enzyme family protein [Planctomycetota bacterium]MCH9790206.1 formylglycine-generating enzyme family protein [Planctomycetota bacterium]
MMIRQRPQLTVSVFAVLILVVAATHADDSQEPNRVLMTKHPLTAEQAQVVQKAWADHLGFEAAFENSIGMQLRVIPPGTFRMSSPKAKKGQKGPVEVTLSQAFLIGQFEVTQGEWKRVMGPIERKLDAGAGDRFPVYRISHTEASEFCRKLTQLDRKAGKLPDGYEYRLPTDAEWEFACRAGTLTLTHFGDKMSSRLANYDGNSPFRDSEKGPNLDRTAQVGTYPANAWGLHEIHGNLCEWCLDWYHHKVEGGVDPVQLEPADWEKPPMVVRDCRWGYHGRYCSSANRYHAPPQSGRSTIGFRPVLSKLHLNK